MTVNHKVELDLKNAVSSIKELGNSPLPFVKKKEVEIKEDPDFDPKEFRFRIKTNAGTDINIPGSFIGALMGVIGVGVIATVVAKIVTSNKK